MIAALGCTNAQLGALTTITTVTGWIFVVPKGVMADRFDSKKLIVLALVLNSCCSFFFAASMGRMGYTSALITWCGLAFSTGLGYWPSLMKFINTLAGPAHIIFRIFKDKTSHFIILLNIRNNKSHRSIQK